MGSTICCCANLLAAPRDFNSCESPAYTCVKARISLRRRRLHLLPPVADQHVAAPYLAHNIARSQNTSRRSEYNAMMCEARVLLAAAAFLIERLPRPTSETITRRINDKQKILKLTAEKPEGMAIAGSRDARSFTSAPAFHRLAVALHLAMIY